MEILEKIEKIYKDRCDLYSEGVLGMANYGIQMSYKLFKSIFKGYPFTIEFRSDHYTVSTEKNGIRYFSIPPSETMEVPKFIVEDLGDNYDIK
jgi:hypothetical protein